jgi:tetratricopeptide (TPR) repeat protein
MGEVYVRLNQPEKAKESFYKALEKAGTNETILSSVMKIMLKNVGEQPLTDWIEEKLANDSSALQGNVMAYLLAQTKGSYNKAIEHLDKCIEISGKDSPNYLIYEFNKINLLIMSYAKTSDQQYMERAITLGDELLNLQPNNASMMNNMAYLLADNDQQLEKALDYSRKAHQSSPDNAVYLDTYAYVQCKTGQYKEAKENLLWAMQIFEASGQPIPWDLYKHLAMVYEGLEDKAQAIENYQKALSTNEQIPEKEKQQLEQAISRLQQ